MSLSYIRAFIWVHGAAAALAITVFSAVAFAAKKPNVPLPPLPSSGSAATLRTAIEDLAATFGARYGRSAEFLARLDAIEQQLRTADAEGRSGAQKDFVALQREALIANPLVSGQPIVFVVRQQYTPGHHNTETFFPSAQHEFNSGRFTPGGALKAVDFARGGAVRTLLDLPDGVVRDAEVHFSGRKIIFSMRRNAADSYHIYEINADGSGLRQLTFAKDVDDLDPLYLPDGSIVFSSTREPKYCMCNRHIMANLHRMEADGANIHQIGKSTLFEGHSALLPDGRILYDRWEYVDRNFGDAQGLWTVNPDGTGVAVYWGNNTGSPGGVLDARPIPGTERVVCTFTSCHDRPWGAIAIVDRALGLDGPAAVAHIWPADARKVVRIKGGFDDFRAVHPKYEDPYPLSDKYFLCSRMTGREEEEMGMYLLDVFGNEILLHAESGSRRREEAENSTTKTTIRNPPPHVGGYDTLGCYDPMPLAPRPRPTAIPSRRDFANREGYFYVQDVYVGTHMAGVKRGAVKSLRVVESPEKRFWTIPVWGGQGIEGPAMNWHDFNNKRILGTVPVEADGSACFAVPSDTFVYFQLLDENGMMIQSMRSGVVAQSGETTSCVGCHEDRRHAPPATGYTPMALRRAPNRLEGWHGPPRLFSYITEVQPVFNRRCMPCHDFGGKAAHKLVLAADRDLVFNASYNELWRKHYIRAVGAGPAETQPAYSWGSHASKLVEAMRKCQERYGVTSEELNRVITWVDLNAPYYPTYASAYPDNLSGRAPLDNQQVARLESLTGVPLAKLANHGRTLGPQVSFERPELSPCLQKFADKSDPKYQEAIAIIRAGQRQLAQRPDADSPGFQSCSLDQWRDQKYAARRAVEERSREAIRAGQRVYDQ